MFQHSNTIDLPKVSILILCYNQRDFISQAIDSALNQDYPCIEIIVADDASSDGSREIILGYAAANPDVVIPVLNEQNGGISRNSNTGLRKATGKYFTHLGGDDLLLPGKVSAQVEWLETDPRRVLCGHEVEVFYDDGSPSHPLAHAINEGSGADGIIRHGAFGACSVMVRMDAMPTHGFETRLATFCDYMMWVETLARGGQYGCLPKVYARYRKHASNVTSNLINIIGDVRLYYKIIAERYPQYRQSCRYGYVRHALYDPGVFLLAKRNAKGARQYFLDAVRHDPLFIRGWIRLFQSYLSFSHGTATTHVQPI